MDTNTHEQRPYTLGQMVRMSRCHRSWKKFDAQFEAARKRNAMLGILARDAAFSHFLGGCSVQLENCGSISRKEFIQLLDAASEFGGRINT